MCHAAMAWYPVLRRGTDASVTIAMHKLEVEEHANDWLRVIRWASLALALSLAVLPWIRTMSWIMHSGHVSVRWYPGILYLL